MKALQADELTDVATLPAVPEAVRKPVESALQAYLEELWTRLHPVRAGAVASYIPELALANPDWFGICVVTLDGKVYEVGDTALPFTIQSISKPFAYGAALEDRGRAAVLDRIWMEPSGEAFNSISLQEGTGRPLNPMINAGAIATTGLIRGEAIDLKVGRLIDCLSRYAGRTLAVDESVYRSESESGHRNRAICHLLRGFGVIDSDPEIALEAYFRQCAVEVNCRDLGIMAATLANGGKNPVTGVRAVAAEHVESILSVMTCCGMYDAAGEWVYNVGMPAKSGVGGGIIAVLPGQLGIGVFSPPLDPHGNSTRGIAACREVSNHFGLHIFQSRDFARNVLRRTYTGNQFRSKRLRRGAADRFLAANGTRISCLELQGNLAFATAEIVTRELVERSDEADFLIVDFRHVHEISPAAADLIEQQGKLLIEAGRRLIFTHHSTWVCRDSRMQLFDDIDTAFEACENELLGLNDIDCLGQNEVDVALCWLLNGLDDDELDALRLRLRRGDFAAGETVIRVGEPADEIAFPCLWYSECGPGNCTWTENPGCHILSRHGIR